MKRSFFLIPILVIVLLLGSRSIFVVDERQRALVLQFGQIVNVINDPGLNFKAPWQNVEYYEDRILSLDTSPTEVTPSDDRRLVVDAFARYRIVDVEQFRTAVPGGIRAADDLLEGILNDRIRAVLGADGVTSNTILSDERAALMQQATIQARARAASLGITVLDVRLIQTNLPAQNLDATFARMRAEREREAADEIARGEEAAQRIRAQADRTVVELVSDASREAEITRGEADAERTRIFAEAFGQDAEFYDFTRSLAAYERALRQNSTFVISPDSEFFEYFDGSALGGGNSLSPPPAE
ncbi:protease modulator HflC [Hasllibacter sp. MH4015]|uniref:protease modulator HflC n=1 Tax=Hasllibacter sp. MH4015 TaxID=2854029 RepID=UPI001CD22D62|nr:protease modulator HflC [Hasllibacter sp. MH4015]